MSQAHTQVHGPYRMVLAWTGQWPAEHTHAVTTQQPQALPQRQAALGRPTSSTAVSHRQGRSCSWFSRSQRSIWSYQQLPRGCTVTAAFIVGPYTTPISASKMHMPQQHANTITVIMVAAFRTQACHVPGCTSRIVDVVTPKHITGGPKQTPGGL